MMSFLAGPARRARGASSNRRAGTSTIGRRLTSLRAGIRLSLLAGLSALGLAGGPATAQEYLLFDGFTLDLRSPLDPCDRDCAATLFAGQLVKTSMWSILVQGELLPWDWRWGSSTFVGGTFSREVVRFDRYASFEFEGGAGKRFGSLDEGEIWGAIYLRWKLFPWNDYLRTSIAVSTGLNYATGVPVFEALRTGVEGQNLLHYLAPEITLGLPSQPNLDLVLRLHHRSGGHFSFFNHAGGGVQYGTVGLRYRW